MGASRVSEPSDVRVESCSLRAPSDVVKTENSSSSEKLRSCAADVRLLKVRGASTTERDHASASSKPPRRSAKPFFKVGCLALANDAALASSQSSASLTPTCLDYKDRSLLQCNPNKQRQNCDLQPPRISARAKAASQLTQIGGFAESKYRASNFDIQINLRELLSNTDPILRSQLARTIRAGPFPLRTPTSSKHATCPTAQSALWIRG